MKIKTEKTSYREAVAKTDLTHIKPKRPNRFFRMLMRSLSEGELKKVDFTYEMVGMDKLLKKEPCLILMNHSSFIDLKIVAKVFMDRPYNIVMTSDGFVGKEWLMRNLGCIPTKKFMMDTALIKSISYCLHTLHDSVLMYPEASYSFDGTATPLPESLGKCLKFLKVPVVMIRTQGAFLRDPLYNNLQTRDVKVSARVEYLLSKEDVQNRTVGELNEILAEQFSFDNFRIQQEQKIEVKEAFRADGLNRVLYKCPHCMKEGEMKGKGVTLTCHHCNAAYRLSETGYLEGVGTKALFTHVPDWYRYERECVKQELINGTYELNIPVDIRIMVNTKKIYEVGEGILTHTASGFHLTGADGEIDYVQKPLASYSLYSDYYWYEIGDVICIGNHKILYYCFPKTNSDVVAKARLATEELYKLVKAKQISEA